MTFTEFFPLYMQAHSKPATQKMHAAALVCALSFGAYCILSAKWSSIPIAFAIGYGMAWSGHLLFEKNSPLFFKHPILSFFGEFKLAYLVLTGKL